MVWPRQKDARGQNTKVNYGMDTMGEKKKRTSKKNEDGRSISSHDNKKFRTRSMEKQGETAFGFRKTATAVIKLDR
jgi:Tfp pilus assembly ATPase PilU